MKQLLFFYLLIPFLSFSQTQIGADIDGEATVDWSAFGTSVSLSSDGSIVAIGSPNYSVIGSGFGQVKVYENVSGVWTKLGGDIDGEYINGHLGYSLSLSSNGNILAISSPTNSLLDGFGHVKIYENAFGDWTQIGDDIVAEAAGDFFGASVSLSSDGSIIAIRGSQNDGSNGINSGHVRIYENISGTWTQIGSDIDGEAYNNYFGYSVSLSNNGNIVAIGAPTNAGNGNFSGHVRIYENISGIWTQIGDDIDAEAAGDENGKSVSLSSDGSIVVIGASGNSGNGYHSGQARVFENTSGVWTQIGDDIDGEDAENFFGGREGVSISDDGSIIAVGASLNSGVNGIASGHVRVYKNISGVWTQLGTDIDGEAAYDNFGYSVSLSSDGSIVAIGAIANDGNGTDSGHVRIYDLNAVLSTERFNKDYFAMYPNPVKDVLNINLNKGLELKQVNVYNVLSRYFYSTKELKLDTNNLKSGVYFIEIVTDKGKSAKKIIVE